jgi:predicted Fe-S protein YdhL (DUF1289 family)
MSTPHSSHPSPLENLHIASPCHAEWDAMSGDEQARFCKGCQKNVFNISMMSRAEAEKLIREKEGHLCVRYAQRADGTIITQDCPVGLEKAKIAALRPWRYFAAGVAALLASVVTAFGGQANPPQKCEVMGKPAMPTTQQPRALMGEMAIVTPKPTQTPAPTMGQPVVLQGGATPPKQLMGTTAAPAPTARPKTTVKKPVKAVKHTSAAKKR